MLFRTSSAALAAALAITAATSAQAGFYSFSQSTTGTYVPITSGTLLAVATTSAAALDDFTFAVPLPFAVAYNDVFHTQIQVNTNGWLAFGGISPGTTNYAPLSSTAVTPGFVAAFAADLDGGYLFTGTRTIGSNQITAVNAVGPLSVGDVLKESGLPFGTTITAISGNTLTISANAIATGTSNFAAVGPWSDLRWTSVGTAPNREVVVQWRNFRRYGDVGAANAELNLNFQIRLHENGTIRAVYGNCSPGVSTNPGVFQTGLRGPTNAFPANVNGRQNVKGASDWATSTPATSNASGQVFNNVAPANVIPSGLTYTWAPPVGVIASNLTIGSGCGGTGFNSFYQSFSTAAVAAPALTGNALLLTPTATGYAGAWLPGAAATLYVTPTAPTTLATGNDGVVALTPSMPLATPYGPQATLQVSGNGIIGFGTGTMDYPGTNAWTPTPAGMLNSALGGIYSWHDYNSAEAGSGPIQREEIGGTLYITFNGVENYSIPVGPNPSTMQFQLVLATGLVRIVWVSIDNNTTSGFSTAHLVGVTAPGASRDPGAVNLATGTLLSGVEFAALALAATNRPVQTAAPSAWNLLLSNVQPSAAVGVDVFGTSDPNIFDLGLFGLGQANCQLRASLDVVNVWLATGASSHSYSLTIPPSPVLTNVLVFTQSAVLGNGNAANNTTSNGIRGLIGNL